MSDGKHVGMQYTVYFFGRSPREVKIVYFPEAHFSFWYIIPCWVMEPINEANVYYVLK